MASVQDLSEEQNAALSGIHVGDLILLRKAQTESDESESDEGEGSDSESESDDEDEVYDEDEYEREDQEATAADKYSNDNPEIATPDLATPNAAATAKSQTDEIYIVVSLEGTDSITGATVALLKGSAHPGTAEGKNSYQLYGDEVLHNVDMSTIGQLCDPEVASRNQVEIYSLQELVVDGYFEIVPKPEGDLVRELFYDGECPAECEGGLLQSRAKLDDMIVGWTIPTSANHPRRPLCPGCMGLPLMKKHQELHGFIEAVRSGAVDMTEILTFTIDVNARRRELGYGFRQFDEREWAYHFDDMLDEQSNDQVANPDDGWEDFREAMDTQANIALRPASQAAIDALTRKTYGEVKTDEEALCQVCHEVFEDDDKVLVVLPCAHMFCDDGCISEWLKHKDNCPVCRRKVGVSDAITETNEPAAGLDGDDVLEELEETQSDVHESNQSDESDMEVDAQEDGSEHDSEDSEHESDEEL